MFLKTTLQALPCQDGHGSCDVMWRQWIRNHDKANCMAILSNVQQNGKRDVFEDIMSKYLQCIAKPGAVNEA